MPTIEVIKASDAPSPPKKVSKIAAQIIGALESLKKDEVLKLRPDEGKSLRGLKTSIGRVASNHGLKVESWDDNDHVYVKKVE